MRVNAFIACLVTVLSCLCSPVSTAQETRPLTTWIDTVRMNVCGPKTFQTAIRVASVLPGDTIIGFRRSDNVASATLYVTWDPATLDLDDFVLRSGTMSERIKTTVRKFPTESTLEIVIADDAAPFGTLYGQLPLLYLSGSVKAPDTVDNLDGWIQVTDVELTSDTRFSPEIYRPGYVRVFRDTSEPYTGRLEVSSASFDTLQLDTITVSLRNVRQRRVREVDFTLAADTQFFAFVDTLQGGTLAAEPIWSSVVLDRSAGILHGHFVGSSDLSQDGPLLRILLRRTTDSAFTSVTSVDSTSVNAASCLGRFLGVGASVTASAIVEDTSSTAVPEVGRPTAGAVELTTGRDPRQVTVHAPGVSIDAVGVFDVMGRPVAHEQEELGDGSGYRITLGPHAAAGVYFVQLRIGREQISKQFIFIKQTL